VHPQPPAPPHYAGAAAIIAQVAADYAHLKEQYNEYVELSGHIKAQMIQAVPPLYLEALNHEQVGFANATPQRIMEHLMTTFGVITEIDLENNLQEIRAPWNPDTPIHSVFARGTMCRKFASEGGDAISDATYTRILLHIFHQSGVLETAIDEWAKKPQAQRTLANCETHFIAANLLRTAKASAATRDSLAANTATQTNHTANMAAQANHTTGTPVPTLQSPELIALIAKVAAEAVANATRGQPPRNRTTTNRSPRAYCWTHGSCAHSSKDCRSPKEGHQPNATFHNKMGGSTKNIRDQGNQENADPNTNRTS
jgi:hypothetical protein